MSEKVEKEIKFEAALKRLEDIVSQLEKGDMDLEVSMKLFEEGVGTVRRLQKKLEEAERKIEKLVKDGGAFKTEQMAGPEGDAAPF
ncbi:MAG: exodeoxyribonuclease VII small subunit [Nitrospinota bacterium]|nr:exodeoxyribonuclease VII small subunit [Nitrospinota bacterium]